MSKPRLITHCFLFVVVNVLLISTASASETLFCIVRKSDWLTYSNKFSYRPLSLSTDGFISLSTQEQVISTTHALFPGEIDLLLLKVDISSADPLLKWEIVPGSEISTPRYYGALPRLFIKKTYPFHPNKEGHFSLPATPLLTRFLAHIIPKSLVNKLLSYQDWQQTDRFHQLQVDNFQRPKVQLQWWYFDFFLHDGSSVVLTFIPQHWWEKPGSKLKKNALFTMSLKTKQGVVKRFSAVVLQSDIETSANHLEIRSHLLIKSIGSGHDRTYLIRVNFPEVAGDFTITPTQPPFAAFPTGVMPGILQTVLSGVPLGAPSFSYVSQIPNSTISGSIAWEDYQAQLTGQAYHEQGRLNDTPEHQGSSWTWYHFSGNGWNIFGIPGSYIYLQRGDQILRSGVHIIAKDYTLQNRTFSSPDHAKLLTGGEIYFSHDDVKFCLKLNPASSKTLVCFPSTDPNQVWGTVEGTAILSISEGSATKTLEGQMFLETCSWEISNTKNKE